MLKALECCFRPINALLTVTYCHHAIIASSRLSCSASVVEVSIARHKHAVIHIQYILLPDKFISSLDSSRPHRNPFSSFLPPIPYYLPVASLSLFFYVDLSLHPSLCLLLPVLYFCFLTRQRPLLPCPLPSLTTTYLPSPLPSFTLVSFPLNFKRKNPIS